MRVCNASKVQMEIGVGEKRKSKSIYRITSSVVSSETI